MITLTKTVTMKWKHVLWQNKDQPTKINRIILINTINDFGEQHPENRARLPQKITAGNA